METVLRNALLTREPLFILVPLRALPQWTWGKHVIGKNTGNLSILESRESLLKAIAVATEKSATYHASVPRGHHLIRATS
jgi:hypothetical protein